MPVSIENLNKEVYDVLRSRGYDPIPLDSKGQQDIDIQESDVFRFTFNEDGNEVGTGWVTVEGKEIVFYIGDDLSDNDAFLNFLQFMKRWSQRKLLGFKITNKDHLTSDMKKRTSMKNKEQLGEGYHPMGKKASFNDSVPQVKIILQHTRQIEEGEQRFRNIAKIFVENTNGERFLVPTIRPGIARVYARHVAEGGTPYDEKGKHITSLVEEYTKMAGFVRATRNGQFNESAQRLVTEAVNHYQNLRETLSRMTSHRGYNNYFENYTPVLNEETDDNTSLNELFVQETLDPRIESVMPILKRLNKNLSEMSEVKALEEWVDSLTEVEDATTKTLAEPAEKMLEGIDDLKDSLHASVMRRIMMQHPDLLKDLDNLEMAIDDAVSWFVGDGLEEVGSSDISAIVKDVAQRMEERHADINEAPGAETLAHNQSTEKSNLKAFDLDEETRIEKVKKELDSDKKKSFRNRDIQDFLNLFGKGVGIAEGFTSSQEVADQIIDSLGGEVELTSDDIYRAVEEYQNMMDSPHKLDVDEVVQIVMDKMNMTELEEDLDANQKRAGQLGPTEKVGPKGAVGKLVGASESVELDQLKALSGIK